MFRTLEFTSRDEIGAGAVALRFTPRLPLSHRAGQHAFWRIPGGGVAPFTIASAPGEEHVVLATNTGVHSRLKRALGALTVGDRVQLAGPLSSFTLGDADHDVVMLAQGIGVTPFRSMLADGAGNNAAATLLHVGTGEGPHAGHAYRADTEALAKEASYVIGRAEFGRQLTEITATRPAAIYLVAGTSAFVSATTTALRGHGIDRSRIRRDAFLGATAPSA